MKFTKLHGLGNCYIYVNCFDERVNDAPSLARAVSDRNTGVGSDGLILICPSRTADARMEMYNVDGSRGQMCGNGIRCLAKYVYDHGLSRNNPLRIETDAGIKTVSLNIEDGKVASACVDMGEPRLRPEDLPVKLTQEQMIDHPLEILDHQALMTCVSMGNPHAVIYGVPLKLLNNRGPAGWNLEIEGRRIETAAIFPERTNVHFVDVLHPSEVKMLTWERGSGATQACGTGASAVCVAGVLTKRSSRKIIAHLPGGDLTLEWREADNHVYMTGPAVEIFTGDWPA
ncbi:MAG TPA: diaminopimelate epimerase [Phycisphaerae bacterium]|nr:diaminopimelate epimerase [Phycisphaerae bacterium]HRR84621.1 diaminopimelate epimerase [Phycisphaerae bacterium]